MLMIRSSRERNRSSAPPLSPLMAESPPPFRDQKGITMAAQS
jgi:hypothetical protein